MNYIKAIIFGVVEGVTEWLPVSSTAHMMILNCFMPLDVNADFYGVFEVVIQLAAVLSLLLVFINKIWPFGKNDNPLGEGVLSIVKKDKFFLCLKIAIACIPAIIFKLFLEDYFTIVNENNEMFVVGLSLLIIGIVFILVEGLFYKKKPSKDTADNITYIDALIIGLAQLAAGLFPGVSRSGATIIAGLLLGISRSGITDFTFELSLPVMFGASLMEVISCTVAVDLTEIVLLLLGCISAFVVSLFMIKFILNFIKKNSFVSFGVYRIIAGILVIIFLA